MSCEQKIICIFLAGNHYVLYLNVRVNLLKQDIMINDYFNGFLVCFWNETLFAREAKNALVCFVQGFFFFSLTYLSNFLSLSMFSVYV